MQSAWTPLTMPTIYIALSIELAIGEKRLRFPIDRLRDYRYGIEN